MKRIAILLCALCASVANAQFGFNAPPDGRSVGVADWKTSLVGYWPLDSLNQGKAIDASGNGNVGVATNGPVVTNGIIGCGTYFRFTTGVPNKGSSPLIRTPTTKASIPTMSNITVACWIYPQNNTVSGGEVVMISNSDNLSPYWHNVGLGRESGGKLYFNNYDGSEHQALSDLGYTNVWVHVVGVRSNGTNYVFCNGQPQSSPVVTGSPNISSAATFTIGGGIFYGFNGSLDDVRIYNRGLTTNEISAIYRWGWGQHQGTPTHP